ncbi:aminoglycoside phosphotransferase family protein [Vibrio makurazakiensis]|uniref:phosphotransferase family protein n=1 Tax=Vibrio makurazakiensis TaxID=2910250 RepID=UPI003D13A6CF
MTTQDLSKMGEARVSVELLDGLKCILKQGASDVEVNFYQLAASKLAGVNTPALLRAEGNSLNIEYIPNRISLVELQSNPQTFEQLSLIHSSRYVPSFTVKKHEWTGAATESALSILQLSESAQSAIKYLQSLSDRLFEFPGLISGDTNDGNWGSRVNGELVLFDWERFGYGSPAIDLAPLVKGLGSVSDYEIVVRKYARYNSLLTEHELIKHLIIAKCWIIIEVVNILVVRNNSEALKYINWYCNNVPQWLESVGKVL